MTIEQKKEFTLRISQANKTELLVILYEMALCYLDEADDAFLTRDRQSFTEAIRRVRGCIQELIYSLHIEYELANNLLSIYMYVYRQLNAAETRYDKKHLEPVKAVLQGLLDAYQKLAEQDDSEAVMEHTQTVFSGLTYGKNQLPENMVEQSENRGFLV